MNSNIKILITAIIALIIGLAAGYLLFAKSASPTHEDSHPPAETEEKAGQPEIWTCAMHPQIRQDEPGLCPICEMDLVPLGSNVSDDPLVLTMTKEAVKLINIQTTVVGETGQSVKTLQLNGKVKEDERQASSQVAHIPGRIEQLFVTFKGERVKEGQKLAMIYSPELVTAQRELLEAIKFSDINPNLLGAARNKLRFWKISDRVIEEIEAKGEIRETFTLYAETSGVVTNRKVSVGDYIKQGQVLFDIMNLDNVWVIFDAYEEDLANIRLNNRVKFTTPSIPGKTFTTRITYIDPVINPQTRVAALRAEIGNYNGQLKPEMFVKGTIQSSISSKEKLTIPKTAVLWTGPRSVVYVKLPDMEIPSFSYREIEIGDALGSSYLVKSGLEPGEEVVTYGNFAIDAAAQLNNQQSMMNKVVKIKGSAQPSGPNFMDVTPETFKRQLKDLADKYIALKDAFVATDAKTASIAAKEVLSQFEKVDMTLLKGDAHMYWMEQLKGMKSHTEKITTSEDVEAQRRQFGFLSELLIKTIGAFGLEGEVLFVQHCPMAFDNEGADWLSLEESIKNPYFGDKMMKCGKVTATLPLKMPASKVQRNPNNIHNH